MEFRAFFLRIIVFCSCLVCLLSSCHNSPEATTLFTLMPSKVTHVDFHNDLTDTEDFNIVEYLNYYNGAGVAAGDINNDGLTDLYFAANQQQNKLYLNTGDFSFKDITETAGVSCPGGWKTGVSMADVNGDGWLDIYVCQVGDYKSVQGENHLYINNGDLTFTDQTAAYGLSFKGFSTQSLFFDYDNDGDLDMYLLNHAIHTRGSYGPSAIVRYTSDAKTGDRLYKQIQRNGKPYFVNATQMAGIYSSRIGYGLGLSAGDINLDGNIDLYISNDFHENDYLYVNNGDGTFTEKIRLAMGHTSKSSMGNDMADINNDGLADIISLDMLPADPAILKKSAGEEMMEVFEMKARLGYYYQLSRNALQLNRSQEHFSEIAAYAGVYATDWSWSPLLFDADNDGYKDLFITNGIPRRPNDLDYLQFVEKHEKSINTTGNGRLSDLQLVSMMPSDTLANYAFSNNGDLTFADSATRWGMDQRAFSNTALYADLDNDGDLDYVVSNLNEKCFLYRNNATTRTANHFLRVQLKGAGRNTFGIGARVEVYAERSHQMQQMSPVRGAMSGMGYTLVFGLGRHQQIDSVVVVWPGDLRQKVKSPQVDKTLVLNMTAANANKSLHLTQTERDVLWQEVSKKDIPLIGHRATEPTPFEYLPLLPHVPDAAGPKMAVGDINDDGLEDIYVCAKGAGTGTFMVQDGRGQLQIWPQKAPYFHERGNGNDACFFDADGDGDLDLYLARGNVSVAADKPINKDVLLVNDGRGHFSPADMSLPPNTWVSSCVAAADYDGDGDIDLFVGTIPDEKHYGQVTPGRLLQNDGHGKFRDVTAEQAEGLLHAGMVADAVWEDMNGDEQPELILAGAWMPVSCYQYKAGQLHECTREAGLQNSSGWWNTLEAADLDGDGDMDLIAGNLGLNTKLKASAASPATMYVKDFDGNGMVDPVICVRRSGKDWPMATRDAIVGQLPSLKAAFPGYADYADITSIDQIFTKNQLRQASVLQLQELRSCVFRNDGHGKMTILPLPRQAQLFPVYAVALTDANQDHIYDLLLGGNDYAVNIDFGRYDAGYGLYLEGSTGLKYHSKSMDQSGLVVPGQIRDIAVLQGPIEKLAFFLKKNSPWQVWQLTDARPK